MAGLNEPTSTILASSDSLLKYSIPIFLNSLEHVRLCIYGSELVFFLVLGVSMTKSTLCVKEKFFQIL